MDEDAKVHWAETVDKPRYRQFTISGEPWSLWWDNRNRLHDQNIRSRTDLQIQQITEKFATVWLV
jgi:hypothetical protein